MTELKRARKQKFAALPARAMRDTKLTPADFRVLCAIAAHDRLGANKRGCYASRERLAYCIQGDASTVTRSTKHLVELGYLNHTTDPKDQRKNIYRVTYTSEDEFAMKPSRDEKRVAPTQPRSSEKGCHQNTEDIEFKEECNTNIFRKTENISSETEKISRKPAPPSGVEILNDQNYHHPSVEKPSWLEVALSPKNKAKKEKIRYPPSRSLRSMVCEIERKYQTGQITCANFAWLVEQITADFHYDDQIEEIETKRHLERLHEIAELPFDL